MLVYYFENTLNDMQALPRSKPGVEGQGGEGEDTDITQAGFSAFDVSGQGEHLWVGSGW